jgi:phage shock protein E
MKKFLIITSGLVLVVSFLSIGHTLASSLRQEKSENIDNPLIDQKGFVEEVGRMSKVRENRRVGLGKFFLMALEPNTIILDARSTDKYNNKHFKGAKHLAYTDFTASALAKTIPSKDTRILIYCNNNFTNNSEDFATKFSPTSLNLSTFVALSSYGYRNIYELGPALDERDPRLFLAWER